MSLSGEAVLYASSPNDKIAQEAARQERRRRKVLKELVDTEKTYLHHLQLINKYFYFPLKFAYIVPETVHNTLFSNLEQIYDVNVTLLEQIEQSTIGAAFSQMAPFLKLYSTYANNHQQALNVLQEWQSKSQEFANFISKQENLPELMGLKLPALLITPVQRIPRYKLLLEELLNNTPNEHYDYSKLKEAAMLVENIAVHINEYIRQNENFQKMLSIQRSFDSSAPKLLAPGRTFIKEGPLKKVSRKGGKANERMFFLFSDILLYGKPKFLDGGGKSYTCSCVLPLRHCKVEQVFITSMKKLETGGVFKLSCKEEILLLCSDNREDAQLWSEEIEKAIRKFCDDRQTLRKPSSNNMPLRGRSLRRHRREQKKTETKLYGTTPLRPLSLVRSSSPESDSVSNRSSWYQLAEGYDLDSWADQGMGLSQETKSSFDSSGDLPQLFPTIKESPNSSVLSGYSLRSKTSQENIDPVDQRECRQSVKVRRRKRVAENTEMSSSGSESPPKCRQISSTSSTSSTAWYPPNSPAHLHIKQKSTFNTRLRSYLGKPFKRVQKVKTELTNPCSPFRCKKAVKQKSKS